MGTAKGTNEIITYISLKSGLVVRSSESDGQLAWFRGASSPNGSSRQHVDATRFEPSLATDIAATAVLFRARTTRPLFSEIYVMISLVPFAVPMVRNS